MDMLRGLRSSSFKKTRKMAREKWKQEIDNLDTSAEKLYEDCLQTLKARFQGEGKEVFYRSFENAYRQIYYKRKENKNRYWSTAALVLLALGTFGSGTVAAASLFSIVKTFLLLLKESNGSVMMAFVQTSSPLFLVLFLALGFLAACLFTEFDRRNYKGSWVRHSAAYHRLNITMIRFLSSLMGEEDFMKDILRILEANITSFESGIDNSQSADIRTKNVD